MAGRDFVLVDPTDYVRGTPPFLSVAGTMSEIGDDLRQFVVRDLFAKANSPRWDGAVFLAELDETLVDLHKLLLGSVKSLFKASERKRIAKHLILSPEELWLWWRYMLMPTLMDAEELIKAIKPQKAIDRVQDGDQLIDQVRSGVTSTGDHWGKYRLGSPWRATYKAGLGGAIDISKRVDHFEWGTSPWDLVRATWERIPFSFVADWFVNFGDWLSSLRSLEIVYAQSYATIAIEAEIKYEEGNWVYPGKLPVYDTLLIDRIVNLEPPPLPLIDKRWQNVKRSLDLISLTVGMLKSILKKRRR
jgi:hypothetical protein